MNPAPTPFRVGLLALLVLSGCAAAPSIEETPSMGPSPTPESTYPLSRIATGGTPPATEVRDTESVDGVRTSDILLSLGDGSSREAYLVEPVAVPADPAAAVLWFHWLEGGSPTSNRTEFLDEARELAARGVISLLVQGSFPWTERPSAMEHDVAAVEADVRMLRTALDLLASRPDVDPQRIVMVGHDFGGMYSSVVFGTDDRVAALVMMAPTARWADWFLRYWPISDPEAAYLAAMQPLDPVTRLGGAAGRPILLQFATQDQYVPADVAAEISAAAGESAETRTYDTDHEMDAAARVDRDAWLAEQLSLDASAGS